MKLRALHVRELPGIAEPFSLEELGEGLHLISGPNASGKSSLLRALQLLLTEARTGDPLHLRLGAEFDNDDGRWRVERSGTTRTWYLDGRHADAPPALPERETLQSYLLGVESLLGRSDTDEAIGERFRRELAGDYDLPAVRQRFPVSPRIDRRHGETLQQAERALREAERHNQDLVQRYRRLPELEQQIAETERAEQALGQYREALEVLRLRQRHDELQAGLDAYPPMPSREDGKRCAELNSRLETLRTREREQQERYHKAGERLRQTGLDAPEAVDVSTARKWLNEIREGENRLTQLRKEHARARGEREEAERALGAGEPEGLFRPDAEQVGAIERCANAVYEAECRLSETRARAESTTATGAPDNEGRLDLLGAVTALAGGALLLVIAWTSEPAWSALGALLVLLGAGVGARRLLRGKQSSDPLAGQMLKQAKQEHDRARAALGEAATAAGLQYDSAPASSMQVFVDRLGKLDRARATEAGHEAECVQQEQDLAAQRKRLRTLLQKWNGQPAGDDAPALESALERLEQRRDAAADALRDMHDSKNRLRELEQETGETRQRLAELFSSLQLEPGDQRTLEQRLEMLPEWEALHEKLRGVDAQLQASLKRLDDTDEALARWMEEGDQEAIAAAIRDAQAQIESLQELREEKARIEADRDQAQREHPLEQRRAEYDRAREELEFLFEQRMVAEAGHFLLNDAESRHRSAHQPETLRRADERLRTFTRGHFSLRLDEQAQLRAFDERQGLERTLEELSVGTRMQLLIALRLAWAQQNEHRDDPLPLFLDEALTTTDPERFDAVASALAAESRERGRQIFYLTAQAEDMQRWQRATGIAPQHIDLAEVRRLATAASEPLALPAQRSLPDPRDSTPEDWARQAGIPPVNPRNDAGAIALFHLLRDDLPLLHRIMEDLRVETLGQLDSLVATALGRRSLDEATRDRLGQRIRIAREWVAAWRIGRGRPVERSALEETDAVTERQLDRVDELAIECNRDASAIIEGLRNKRVSRFQGQKIDELEEWLQQHGYLDPRSPLDEDERYRRVLDAVQGDTETAESIRQVVHWLEAAVQTSTNH